MIDFRREPFRPVGHARVPFPSLHAAERVRGYDILEELPFPDAQILWESFRNVGDWALTPAPRRRRGHFPEGAVERRNEQLAAGLAHAEILAPLEIVRDMMAEPRRTDPRLVARACREISDWAGERAALATQFYFAAAAGLCLPGDARQAYHAGRLARDMAKWDAAEVWLEHAMVTARRQKDRETQGMAVLGMGNTAYRQGLYQKAKEAYAAGLVLARRHRLREIEGGALHDLFVVSAETNEYRSAEEFARMALRAYGPGHSRVPGLAQDTAHFWLTRGRAHHALTVLVALLPTLASVPSRVHALASTGRAAGICGDREVFERAWEELQALREQPGSCSRLAPALLEFAHGALRLGDLPRAKHLAASATETAECRGEIDVAERGQALLASMEDGSAVEELVQALERSPTADQLAVELVSSLRAGVDTL